MTPTTENKPCYQHPKNERDLLTMKPGDRVSMRSGSHSEWLTYKQFDHGTAARINPQSIIIFIERPIGYKKGDQMTLYEWRTQVNTLGIFDGSLHFNMIHTEIINIPEENQQHHINHTLLDLLEE